MSTIPRSSRPEEFYKKGVLRNFAKFTRKHLCQILFFNKVVHLMNFVKFQRTPFFCRTPPVATSVYHYQCNKLIISCFKDFGTTNKT